MGGSTGGAVGHVWNIVKGKGGNKKKRSTWGAYQMGRTNSGGVLKKKVTGKKTEKGFVDNAKTNKGKQFLERNPGCGVEAHFSRDFWCGRVLYPERGDEWGPSL